MKAELRFYNKEKLKSGHILEIKIWEILKSEDYPEGIKYTLILVEPSTNNRILMDNHRPKKHHYHINEKEFEYKFIDIDKLFDDFKSLAFKQMRVKL